MSISLVSKTSRSVCSLGVLRRDADLALVSTEGKFRLSQCVKLQNTSMEIQNAL